MSTDNEENTTDSDLVDELKPESSFSVFLIFRYLGMLLLFTSMIFLFQKHKAPIITFGECQLRNGQVGNLLLTLGSGLFFIYLIHKIYSVIKRN